MTARVITIPDDDHLWNRAHKAITGAQLQLTPIAAGPSQAERYELTPGTPREAECADLSVQQHRVLDGIAQGWSNAEIGRVMGISEDTVKTHCRQIFRKVGARDRAQAVDIGHRKGWLS